MKVSITFDVANLTRFKAAYRKALRTSSYDVETRRQKLNSFEPETALAEILSDSGLDWNNFGLGY